MTRKDKNNQQMRWKETGGNQAKEIICMSLEQFQEAEGSHENIIAQTASEIMTGTSFGAVMLNLMSTC